MRDPALKLGFALLGALLFRFERLASERDPMQRRAASRLLLAQGRQGGGGERLQARRLGLRARALGDLEQVRVKPPARLGECHLMLAPGDEPPERLVAADRGGEIAVAVRLTRLTLEAVDLGVDLLQHVLDAQRDCPRRPSASAPLRGGASGGRKHPRPLRGSAGAPEAWPK